MCSKRLRRLAGAHWFAGSDSKLIDLFSLTIILVLTGSGAPPAHAAPIDLSNAPGASSLSDADGGSGTGSPFAFAAQSVTPPPGTMTVTTRAVELSVEGVHTASEIGGRQARPGYEFVILDTAWKNIIPLTAVDKSAPNPNDAGRLGGFGNTQRPPADPANVSMEPTIYVVPGLKDFMWLLSDNRFADTVDAQLQNAVADHLPADGFAIAGFGETLRGTLVFESPANASYRAFQFFDSNYGHAMIPLSANQPPPSPALLGPPQQNEVLQVAVSEAGFGPAGLEAPFGWRYYTVGLRGVSRSPKDIVHLPFTQVVFLQNEHGCVSQPEGAVSGLSRPFGELGAFIPSAPNEGQVAFLVPDDTTSVRVLVTPSQAAGLVLTAGSAFTPSWPAPVNTIEDGSTMRVLVLPAPALPAALPAPEPGRQLLSLDVVVENLVLSQGIEFQGPMQLLLVDPDGRFIQPLPLSGQLACTFSEMDVIPAGNARRFLAVYDVPDGVPMKLHYRGFEVDAVDLEIQP